MSFILIDRRKAGRGKSLGNRQKLVKRIRNFIKASAPQNIGKVGGVTNVNVPKGVAGSPVKVAGSALEEPWFAYANDGDQEILFIGNPQYNRGDEIEFPPEQEGKGGAGQGDSGEDDFIINIARDEFFDAYFEDCELPNLTNEKYTEKLDNKFQQAGFSTTGTPAQLSIIRSYKQSIGRRTAMTAPLLEEIEKLQKLVDDYNKDLELESDPEKITAIKTIIADISKQIEELKAQVAAYDNFDKNDLRYRKREAQPLKTVDAVIFFLMDISGSMDENKKTIARRWFALLYAFIKRRYPVTELVFIAHTDEAFEMSENDFFSTRINGGTAVSVPLKLTNKIIRERYDFNKVNIYVCHASDGDNWIDDNTLVIEELVGVGHLLSKIQLLSYAEVGKNGGRGSGWFNIGNSAGDLLHREDSNLWATYSKAKDTSSIADQKIVQTIIETADDCYPVFKKVFKKKGLK